MAAIKRCVYEYCVWNQLNTVSTKLKKQKKIVPNVLLPIVGLRRNIFTRFIISDFPFFVVVVFEPTLIISFCKRFFFYLFASIKWMKKRDKERENSFFESQTFLFFAGLVRFVCHNLILLLFFFQWKSFTVRSNSNDKCVYL